MKNLSLHTLGSVVLLTIVSTLVVTLYARNSGAGRTTYLSRRAIARAEQSRLDSLDHCKALAALDENRWAFKTEWLSDRRGSPNDLEPNLRSFIAGFDGTFVFAREKRADGRMISRKTNRKGETIFRFRCNPPLGTECTLTLSKDSDFAVFSIAGDRYRGKVMPLENARYFMQCNGAGHRADQ